MKKFMSLGVSILTFAVLTGCSLFGSGVLTDEESDSVSDEIVNVMFAPLDNVANNVPTNVSTTSMAMITPKTMIDAVNQTNTSNGVVMIAQTNDQSGYSASSDKKWAQVKMEGKAQMLSNGNELAYGYVNLDASAALSIDGTDVLFPTDRDGFSNFNLDPPTNTAIAKVAFKLDAEVRGSAPIVSKTFKYSVQIGNGTSDPFTLTATETSTNSGYVTVKGLVAYDGLDQYKISGLKCDYDLKIVQESTNSPTINGTITGSVSYKDTWYDYTMTFQGDSTVVITVDGKEHTKKVASLGKLLSMAK